jgi:hypothetical protein
MFPQHRGDPLERHDRVEGRHLDPDDFGQRQNSVQRFIIVVDPTGRRV